MSLVDDVIDDLKLNSEQSRVFSISSPTVYAEFCKDVFEEFHFNTTPEFTVTYDDEMEVLDVLVNAVTARDVLRLRDRPDKIRIRIAEFTVDSVVLILHSGQCMDIGTFRSESGGLSVEGGGAFRMYTFSTSATSSDHEFRGLDIAPRTMSLTQLCDNRFINCRVDYDKTTIGVRSEFIDCYLKTDSKAIIHSRFRNCDIETPHLYLARGNPKNDQYGGLRQFDCCRFILGRGCWISGVPNHSKVIFTVARIKSTGVFTDVEFVGSFLEMPRPQLKIESRRGRDTEYVFSPHAWSEILPKFSGCRFAVDHFCYDVNKFVTVPMVLMGCCEFTRGGHGLESLVFCRNYGDHLIHHERFVEVGERIEDIDCQAYFRAIDHGRNVGDVIKFLSGVVARDDIVSAVRERVNEIR